MSDVASSTPGGSTRILLLLSLPRTGSTQLARCLDSVDTVSRYGEVFSPRVTRLASEGVMRRLGLVTGDFSPGEKSYG